MGKRPISLFGYIKTAICLFEYIKTAISLFGYIKSHQWENSIDGLNIKLIRYLDTNVVDVEPLC